MENFVYFQYLHMKALLQSEHLAQLSSIFEIFYCSQIWAVKAN